MVTIFDEIVYAVSYLALSLVSLNCLTIYVMQVRSDARSYGYGIFIINAVYGVGGAISTVADHLSHVQVIFYVAQVAFVLPLLATEVWIQNNMMPKQQELVYVPFVLGLLPFFSFIMMGHIRIDLIELCLVYCCVSICYVGCSTKDYMVVSASLLFYLAYNMHYRGKVKISNVLFILFVVCSLGSICPNCIENWMKKSDFPFENNRRFK
ncbi:hypothetical protein WA026_003167 [Henosepilachna vigintioctopunctata]|uniref:Uncharacterized protein n=1 Tax=Henosepilachna vigintioctopunctata TaxID=420089 RepID=A0AAW1TH77_9CUCU